MEFYYFLHTRLGQTLLRVTCDYAKMCVGFSSSVLKNDLNEA